jgi:hypothetical protein
MEGHRADSWLLQRSQRAVTCWVIHFAKRVHLPGDPSSVPATSPFKAPQAMIRIRQTFGLVIHTNIRFSIGLAFTYLEATVQGA